MRRTRKSSDAMVSLRSARLRGGFLASALPGNPGLSSSPTGTGLSTQSGPSLPAAETSTSASPHDSFTLETDHVAALNSIMRVCKFMQDKSVYIERRVLSIEEKQAKLSDILKELRILMKKHIKDSFAIKGSSFEFISSLPRDPPDTDIQKAVVDVMGQMARDKHKFDLAFKYSRAKLTAFHTKKRRKILGHKPYEQSCYLSTMDLAKQILKQMHVQYEEEDDLDTYTRHLAVMRKFVRECCNEKEVNYNVFRQWLGNSIPNISEDMWSNILQEDLAFDYSTRGSGLGSQASVSDECEMTTEHESSDVVNATEDASEYTETS